jgi:hypothetical protein
VRPADHVPDTCTRRHHGIHVLFLLDDKVDQDRTVNRPGLLDGRDYLALLPDGETRDTICLSDLGKVGSQQRSAGIASLEEQLLPLAHHPQVAIIEDRNLDRQPLLSHSGQFLDIHLETTIADSDPDLLIGPAHLSTYGGGQGKAHRPQATGG